MMFVGFPILYRGSQWVGGVRKRHSHLARNEFEGDFVVQNILPYVGHQDVVRIKGYTGGALELSLFE
jgi:hypothetical protein